MRLLSFIKSRRFKYLSIATTLLMILILVGYFTYQLHLHSKQTAILRELASRGYAVSANQPQPHHEIGSYFVGELLVDLSRALSPYQEADSYAIYCSEEITTYQLADDINAILELDTPLSFRFARSKITDLEPLAEIPNLYAVELDYCPELTDISSLQTCPNLQMLEIHSCSKLNLQEQLLGINTLVYLTVNENNSLYDADSISQMQQLERLKVADCDNFQDFSGLYLLEQLETIFISQKNAPQDEIEMLKKARPTTYIVHDH